MRDSTSYLLHSLPKQLSPVIKRLTPRRRHSGDEEVSSSSDSVSLKITMLATMFPDLPLKMIHCLVVKYEGNCEEVKRALVLLGWNPMIDYTFTDSADPHFTTPYFFGHADERTIEQAFRQKLQPSYLTCFKYNHGIPEYYLYINDDNGNLKSTKIKGPQAACPPGVEPIRNKKDIHISLIPAMEGSSMLACYETLM